MTPNQHLLAVKEFYAKEVAGKKHGVFSSKGGKIINDLTYLSGINYLDVKIQSGEAKPELMAAMFEFRTAGLILTVPIRLAKFRYFGIPYDAIKAWSIQPQQRFEHKESKSIVGRAIVGGILLGPLGAVIGGASGVGDKTKSISATGYDNILLIEMVTGEVIAMDCPNKKLKGVLDLFRVNMPGKQELLNQ